MKKFILIIIALFLFTGCSSGKQNNSNKASSDGTGGKSVYEDSGNSKVEKISGSDEAFAGELSEEDVLYDLRGMYVKSDYMEEFRNTKSIVSAYDHMLMVFFGETENEYSLGLSDGHQGSESHLISSVEYIGDGKYSIKAEDGDYTKNCEIVYTPGKRVLEFAADGDYEKLSTGGELEEFERFKSEYDFTYRLTEILFDGIDEVECAGDNVFADINGTRYSLSVACDYVGLSVDAINVDSYSGALFAEEVPGGYRIIMKYKYDEDSVTLYDLDDNVIKSFSIGAE